MDNREHHAVLGFFVYQIGKYLFDEGVAHLISPDNEVEELSPLTYRLLMYLMQHQARLVSKRELITYVWKHEVSDSPINKSMSILRTHFCDNAQHPQYIVTRRRLGYRIVAMIQKVPCDLNMESDIKHGSVSSHTPSTALNNSIKLDK